MNTTTYTKERTFDIKNLSEQEARALRTLLNLNEGAVEEKLMSDEGYWDQHMEEETAVEVGIEVRDAIFEMVDL